jgi:hypothetical protein
MTDHEPALRERLPVKFSFGALLVAAAVSSVWIIIEAIQGADLQSLIAVPLLVGAWLWGILALDRWVGGASHLGEVTSDRRQRRAAAGAAWNAEIEAEHAQRRSARSGEGV